jgi:hypothetical protein
MPNITFERKCSRQHMNKGKKNILGYLVYFMVLTIGFALVGSQTTLAWGTWGNPAYSGTTNSWSTWSKQNTGRWSTTWSNTHTPVRTPMKTPMRTPYPRWTPAPRPWMTQTPAPTPTITPGVSSSFNTIKVGPPYGRAIGYWNQQVTLLNVSQKASTITTDQTNEYTATFTGGKNPQNNNVLFVLRDGNNSFVEQKFVSLSSASMGIASASFTTKSDLKPGMHKLSIGVYSKSPNRLVLWHNNVAAFNVTNEPTPTPTPTP